MCIKFWFVSFIMLIVCCIWVVVSVFFVVLEGVLKFKEFSYIYVEGYVAGEMKYGFIVFIDEDVFSVVVCFEGFYFEKILFNVVEINI